ncbi:hypothetical protein L228DRAFT_265666 [Xylona heveae TC161]|uniref:Reticulon-like protein n=1 Tax=Xylona heveae (strain CBS 132557 / TC161) TaxID=1328760 RepID=A0A165IPH2_XYLHT|nr:hypothetical protein L228DRAFT_265666 [Xylona heveae TC161]KZF25191.1 hypothetical protein L228DRAFT_265666 [Xylona heveae TC161]
MTDAAPQIPTPHFESPSDVTYPSTEPVPKDTPSSNAAAVKESVVGSTQSALNSVQEHPYTKGALDAINDGRNNRSHTLPPTNLTSVTAPVTQSVKNESAKTSADLRNLANSRTRPDEPAVTGQPLTHYHSMFYSLLSWEHPRATAISFASTVLLIFAARYFPLGRYVFKILYVTLGAAATAEIVGKLVFTNGLASQLRPRKYYTISQESFDRVVEDVQELVNFFVIEFQRILFAENVKYTVTAFFSSLVSYWLIKVLPFWGLALLATTIFYLGPLVYITNRELIDGHIQHASDIVGAQATQFRDLAGHHTAQATETLRGYAGEYTNKAQQYIGSARGKSASPVASPAPKAAAASTPVKSEPVSYTSSDFPAAPNQEPTPIAAEFTSPTKSEAEPVPAI